MPMYRLSQKVVLYYNVKYARQTKVISGYFHESFKMSDIKPRSANESNSHSHHQT